MTNLIINFLEQFMEHIAKVIFSFFTKTIDLNIEDVSTFKFKIFINKLIIYFQLFFKFYSLFFRFIHKIFHMYGFFCYMSWLLRKWFYFFFFGFLFIIILIISSLAYMTIGFKFLISPLVIS